jgi:hypothetical protein
MKTYERLEQENAELRQENSALRQENAVLKQEITLLKQQNLILCRQVKVMQQEIAELMAKLNKNSKNSSKPPSSDQKSNSTIMQSLSKRPYHPGAQRQLLPEERVTSRERRVIEKCPRCRSPMVPTGEVEKYQQIELPPIAPLVHQIELVTCQCTRCALVQTPLLENHEVYLMGPRLEGLACLLMAQFRQSHQSVREFLQLILPDVKLSQGLISKVKNRSAQVFDKAANHITNAIFASTESKCTDVTGWRHQNKNMHAIILRTQSLVRYHFNAKQNGDVLAEILRGEVDSVTCDRGLAIGRVKILHLQYCLSHFLRNIAGIAEHPEVTLEETQALGEIHETLQELFHDKHRCDRGEISSISWRQYSYQKWRWMRKRCQALYETTASKSLKRFCKRALRDWPHFMTYLSRDAPMTNNLAEEGLRNLVIARKLCFGTRSNYGLKWREVVHTCVETLKRIGQSILDFFAGSIYAFRRGQPCPMPM